MKLVGMILVIAAMALLMSIEIVLDAIPWSVLRPMAIVAGAVLFVLAVIAVMCAMYSSKLSREEEAAARNHAVKVEDYNPPGFKWS